MIPACGRRIVATLVLASGVTTAGAFQQETADQAVQRVLNGLAQGRLEVVWQALPPSYQNDIRTLIQGLAPSTPAARDLHDRRIALFTKLARVMREKQDLILAHPMVTQARPLVEVDELQKREYMNGVAALSDLLADLFRQVDTPDIEAFLTNLGSQLQQFDRGLLPSLQQAGDSVVTLVSSDGDAAVLRLQEPDGQAMQATWVRVEGKWIPGDMADEWATVMEDARSGMANVQPQTETSLAQQSQAMGLLINGADSLLAADSPEAFDAALQGLTSAVMMAAAQFQQGG